MDKTNSKMYINNYGHKVWKNLKGEYHREDGLAYETSYGYKTWWLNNIKFSKEEFNSWIKRLKIIYNKLPKQ